MKKEKINIREIVELAEFTRDKIDKILDLLHDDKDSNIEPVKRTRTNLAIIGMTLVSIHARIASLIEREDSHDKETRTKSAEYFKDQFLATLEMSKAFIENKHSELIEKINKSST